MDNHPLPTVLYHYTDARGLLGIIEKQAIWATNIHYLNDSQEFYHSLELAESVILEKAQAEADQRVKEALMALHARLSTRDRADVFVASFSQEDDLLSQWRGYCPNGAGYSIGFGARELIDEAQMQKSRLSPCLYDEEDQREATGFMLSQPMQSETWTQALQKSLDDRSYQQALDAWSNYFFTIAPMLKHKAFREERELRLISDPISPLEPTAPRWKFRAGKSMLLPYVEIKLTVVGSHIPIKEIVVGPTPQMGLATDAVGPLLDPNGIYGVTVRNSMVPFQNL